MKTIATDIRLAEPDDAAALAEVHEAAWLNAYSGLIPNRSLHAMVQRRGPDWWRRALHRGAAILVFQFDGRVAGYATLGRNRAPALLVDGEIYELYLQPEFQGLGFGGRLFRAAGSVLTRKGLKGLAVWCLADNERAMRFYAAIGGHDIAEGEECFEGTVLRKVGFIWPVDSRF
ncbi:GNAT family N-acetyltransferase [Consotaella aegiceratis]|uniref:GNAT family N-acetyltransferase n=1 Tax=Consotaella aegiceratis TaxID=3097961 RepID=UPI002F4114F4